MRIFRLNNFRRPLMFELRKIGSGLGNNFSFFVQRLSNRVASKSHFARGKMEAAEKESPLRCHNKQLHFP